MMTLGCSGRGYSRSVVMSLTGLENEVLDLGTGTVETAAVRPFWYCWTYCKRCGCWCHAGSAHAEIVCECSDNDR